MTSPLRIITCREFGEIDIAVADLIDADGNVSLHPDIQTRGYFAVTLKRKVLTLRANGYVGLIPLTGSILIDVRPRVPVENLATIVARSEHRPTALATFRGYRHDNSWNDLFIGIYAESFASQLDVIAELGLLQQYEERSIVTSLPVGRLDVGRTATTLIPKGIKHKVHTKSWHRSTNVAFNQLLLAALDSLQAWFGKHPPTERNGKRLMRRLNAHRLLFSGVAYRAADVALGFRSLDRVPLPAVRNYYAPAVALAKDIVRRQSILLEGIGDSTPMPSLVVDMADVFERYMRLTLVNQAAALAPSISVRDGNLAPAKRRFYTEHSSPEATPDIVVSTEDGRVRLIGEVKNVPTTGFSDRDQVEQGLGYAMVYNCRRVCMIHPCRSGSQVSGLFKSGSVGPVEVFQYFFDLAADDLAEEEVKYASALVELTMRS